MAIQVTNNSILKPSVSSAQPMLPSLVPLTIFDKAALNIHVATLHAFEPPLPSNEVLKNALSEVLVHFPHLAGRLTVDEQGQQCILLNNAGIRLVEAYVPANLADHVAFDSPREINHLYPPVDGIEDLLQIQLNRFRCEGLVIGLTAHHRVADGQSMSSFLATWARLVRGFDIERLPCHSRDTVLVPRSKLRIEFDHGSVEFHQGTAVPESPILLPVHKIVTHFTTDFINKIKQKVREENITVKARYSTFECLLAHVWKKVTQVRGLELETFTQVKMPVNGRTRMKPAVPAEYFGNLILWANPRLTVREVLTMSHAYIAKAIHDAVSRMDDQYFQSFIDFGELSKRNGENLEGITPEIGIGLCPDLEADSWMRFQFHDLDFGGGPCTFCQPEIHVEGVLIFLPSCREGGGIDVVISLLPEQGHLFRQICHTLN